MRKIFLLFLLITTTVFFAAYHINSGNKYTGKWVGERKCITYGEPEVVHLNIENIGNIFLVKIHTSSYPEVLVGAYLTADGKLKMNHNSAGSRIIVYSEKDGTLLWNGIIFKKKRQKFSLN